MLFAFHREEQAQLVEYRTEAGTCNVCPVKMHCTSSKRGRHLHRSFFAAYQDRVKSYHQTLAYQKAMNKRKVWVEPLFGEGKQWHGMRRFRLRRLWRVNCEALVIAAGQNLKRLLQKRGWGRHPFPTEAMALTLPRSEKPKPASKDHWLSYPEIAVASLAASWASRSFSEPQKSLFSLDILILSQLSFILPSFKSYYSLVFPNLLLFLILSFSEIRQAHLLFISSAGSFSTGCGRF